MSSTEPEDTIYFGAPWEAAQTFVLGQGFESVSHDRLQRSINKEWFQRLKKAGISPTRILSKAAKALISADIGQGRYRDRTSTNEPAYMSPSTDPTQYSLWCSFCYDFRETPVLCAGCRVGLCSAGLGSMRGCIVWDPRIRTDDFIFFCPYCIKSQKRPCSIRLAEPTKVPERWSILFRYDPAVLIVSIQWLQNAHSFGKLLRDRLCLSYANNEESIKRSLKSTQHPEDSLFKVSKDVSLAERFLGTHSMAKIIIVIHTHCLNNGFFVWTGDSPETYHACSLLEGIFKYLSNAEGTPSHNHKSLILNLACGNSISQVCARSKLLDSHCADVVLSLANNTTVVSKVSARLLDLVAYWVQTLSDYNVLVAKAMTCDWAKEHMPHPSPSPPHLVKTTTSSTQSSALANPKAWQFYATLGVTKR
ncbi:hypothetical protein BDM02DRAFT_3188658 [Thelephora ganbajun]|uniref:Uncharacterized protein n=1 Tax=Thelephora ganbajun TaxID=370292 RepID=A0ACB6ZAQ7_THEGA|nr:hypothetical protein BDM02DRAFT_3188658 [Thelephora ganbajun]